MLKRIPFRLIGLLLLAYILYTLDLGQVIARLRQIGFQSGIWAGFGFSALLVFRCWRWHVLASAVGGSKPVRQNLLSANESLWLGMVTPGRLGEFRRAADLADHGNLGIGAASALVLFDLSLDLCAFASLALAGGLYLFLGPGTALAWSFFVAALLLGFVVLTNVRMPIAASIRWMPLTAKIPGIGTLLPLLRDGLENGPAVAAALLTAFVSLAYILTMWPLVAPMGIDIGLLQIATMVGFAGVAGAVPITYFGLGTRDIALIWYFGQLGIDKETAVAVSFTFLLAQLIGIVVSFCAGLILPRIWPVPASGVGEG